MIISNKPAARDPEGETILHDLVKKKFKQVRSIRAGKSLRLEVEAEDAADAEALVRKMCDELRIYNPAAHSCEIRAEGV